VRLLVAALCLLVTSCASTPLTFRFDEDTTQAERTSALRGMANWNAEALPDSQLTHDPLGAYRITFTDDIEYKGQQMDGRVCSAAGPDCKFGRWVRIRRGLPEPRLTLVATHELGHAMGIGHVDDPQSVMFRGLIQAPGGFTDVDRRACQGAGRCGSGTVRKIAINNQHDPGVCAPGALESQP